MENLADNSEPHIKCHVSLSACLKNFKTGRIGHMRISNVLCEST